MRLTLTNEEIQLYIPVSNTFVPDNFDTYINHAKNQLAYKHLSKEQTDALITANADDDVTEMLKRAIINYAYYLYIPFANVQMSNVGITQSRTETQIAAKAEAVEDLKQACYESAFENIEQILQVFESDQATYSLWAASTANTLAKELLFTTATDFSNYVNILSYRRVFVTLIPAIRIVQLTQIRDMTGKDLYNDLLANRDTTDNKILLDGYIKPALAYLAMARALPNLSIQLGKYDMALLFDNKTSNRQRAANISLSNEMLRSLVQHYTAEGKDLLCRASQYIADNADTYPLYGALPTTEQSTDLYGDVVVAFI